jgi:hypothetical protein
MFNLPSFDVQAPEEIMRLTGTDYSAVAPKLSFPVTNSTVESSFFNATDTVFTDNIDVYTPAGTLAFIPPLVSNDILYIDQIQANTGSEVELEALIFPGASQSTMSTYYETSGAITWDNGFFDPDPSTTLTFRKINDTVHIMADSTLGTVAAVPSANYFTSSTLLASNLRPAYDTTILVRMIENGTGKSTPGMLRIFTTGAVSFYFELDGTYVATPLLADTGHDAFGGTYLV